MEWRGFDTFSTQICSGLTTMMDSVAERQFYGFASAHPKPTAQNVSTLQLFLTHASEGADAKRERFL